MAQKAMKKTLNAQLSTFNAQWLFRRQLNVERWMLNVGRSL